jgi:hypothetical protein
LAAIEITFFTFPFCIQQIFANGRYWPKVPVPARPSIRREFTAPRLRWA